MFLIITVLVGAIIGIVTNGIAIMMLFRPWHEVRILGWRLPFTPGLMPRRQAELAKKIGDVVERELITVEGVGAALSDEWLNNLRIKIHADLDALIKQRPTIEDWLKTTMGQKQWGDFKHEIPHLAASRVLLSWNKREDLSLRTLIPVEWVEQLHVWLMGQVPVWMAKLSETLDEPAARNLITQELQSRLTTLGPMFGPIATKILRESRLLDAFLDQVQTGMRSESAVQFVQRKLDEQLNTWGNRTLVEWKQTLGGEEIVEAHLASVITGLREDVVSFSIDKWWSEHPNEVDGGLRKGLTFVHNKMLAILPQILNSIGIAKIVERKVADYSLQELEKLIVEVVRKELQMITLLGGVLGAFIGLLQVLLMGWFS